MKKSIMTITILLIFTTGVAASNNYYWDNFMENSGVDYQPGEGRLTIFKNLKEPETDQEVPGNPNHQINFNYTILRHSEFDIQLYSEDEFFHSGKLKYNFLRANWLNMTGMVGAYLVQDNVTVPSIKLISDEDIFYDNLILHNNFQLYFNQNELLKLIENGFTYTINEKNAFKGYVGTFIGADFSDVRYNLKVAYKYKVNDELDYYNYSYYQKRGTEENIHIENIVEFRPSSNFNIKSNITVNTNKKRNNWIGLSGEKQLFNNMRLLLEYKKETDEKGASYLKAGLSYSL